MSLMILAFLASVTTTPSTLSSTLASAKPGARIKLAPGDYGTVTISNLRFDPPITLDASAARMNLVVTKSNGLKILGGTFGPSQDARGYAARLLQSHSITFERPHFTDSKRGLVIDRSQHVLVNGARITKMTIDGINIASSQHITVLNSICSDFNTGKQHPDCIQGWSRPQTGVTSDILLKGNRSTGPMQGFAFFNHVRDGLDDGGFDRIRIEDNVVNGTYPQGINVTDCRNCVVTGNTVSTLPGARWRTSINVVRGTVRSERNIVRPKN